MWFFIFFSSGQGPALGIFDTIRLGLDCTTWVCLYHWLILSTTIYDPMFFLNSWFGGEIEALKPLEIGFSSDIADRLSFPLV